MTPEIAHYHATRLLRLHGLTRLGWEYRLEFSTKRNCGRCYCGKKQIRLSRWYILQNSNEMILNTILHEIAHALCWERHQLRGHCAQWRAICVEVGAKPQRLNTNCIGAPRKYIAACNICLKVYNLEKPKHGRYYHCRNKDCQIHANYRPLVFKPNPGMLKHVAQRAAEDTPESLPEIELLLRKLAECGSDKREAKRLRSRLRTLGHRGGLK